MKFLCIYYVSIRCPQFPMNDINLYCCRLLCIFSQNRQNIPLPVETALSENTDIEIKMDEVSESIVLDILLYL